METPLAVLWRLYSPPAQPGSPTFSILHSPIERSDAWPVAVI